jgi:pyruvate formate lyase activating enzyme
MAECGLCHNSAAEISRGLGVCLSCIREEPSAALARAMEAHRRSRAAFGQPETPPKDPNGASCKVCVHECRIPEHGVGYCGLRRNEAGEVKDVTAERGKLTWYHDPLPTNCVGDWVCAGCGGAGYPKYAHCRGPELGYRNLAVFFQACSFNCLYCQNWEFRLETLKPRTRAVEDLVSAVDETTSCICYFGGDPAPQLPFSLRASRLARRRHGGRILRICWETNGSMHPGLLDDIAELALESGGCIKFDLKAWDDNLHVALTGVSNRRTLENFVRAGARCGERPSPPLVIASTLLIPGYIDELEVAAIARFIAGTDPDTPYSLLGFHPHFHMGDLPLTSRAQAERCRAVALAAGLTNVHLANVHLLASLGW